MYSRVVYREGRCVAAARSRVRARGRRGASARAMTNLVWRRRRRFDANVMQLGLVLLLSLATTGKEWSIDRGSKTPERKENGGNGENTKLYTSTCLLSMISSPHEALGLTWSAETADDGCYSQ